MTLPFLSGICFLFILFKRKERKHVTRKFIHKSKIQKKEKSLSRLSSLTTSHTHFPEIHQHFQVCHGHERVSVWLFGCTWVRACATESHTALILRLGKLRTCTWLLASPEDSMGFRRHRGPELAGAPGSPWTIVRPGVAASSPGPPHPV